MGRGGGEWEALDGRSGVENTVIIISKNKKKDDNKQMAHGKMFLVSNN